jgi:hypothetical protein
MLVRSQDHHCTSCGHRLLPAFAVAWQVPPTHLVVPAPSCNIYLLLLHNYLHRWAESELLESLTRLELALSGHVEVWKASRWGAKLEQLKQRNDALADGMAAAVRRLAASEDGAHEAQLRCEMAEVGEYSARCFGC